MVPPEEFSDFEVLWILKGDPLKGHPTWRMGSQDVVSITMVIVSPLRIGLWDPFQMACLWLVNGVDPNYLLTGMILQAHLSLKKKKSENLNSGHPISTRSHHGSKKPIANLEIVE